MKKQTKWFLILSMLLCIIFAFPVFGASNETVRLNTTQVKMPINGQQLLFLKNVKGSVKWSVSSSGKNVTLIPMKNKCRIIAEKKGTSVVTASVGNKKYKCSITVYQDAISKTAPEARYVGGEKPMLIWEKVNGASGYLLQIDTIMEDETARSEKVILEKTAAKYLLADIPQEKLKNTYITICAYKDTSYGRIQGKYKTIKPAVS